MLKRVPSIVLTVFVVLLLALSVGSYTVWIYPWELISHFRVQYFFVSVVLCVLLITLLKLRQFKNRALLFSVLVLVGLNFGEILPWYLPHPQQHRRSSDVSHVTSSTQGQSIESDRLRLLSVNVNTRNDRYAPTIEMVRKQRPDIVLFVEMNPEWIKQLSAGLGDIMPYRYAVPEIEFAIWSRFPLKDPDFATLDSPNLSIVATIPMKDQAIQFVGVHTSVPTRRWFFASRNLQLEGLSRFARNLNQPLIVMGDFNLTPWSPYYRRLIRQTGLHNARLGFGILPSYPSPSTLVKLPRWVLPFVSIPIDHALVSQHFDVLKIDTIEHGNADHAALMTELMLR